MERSEENNRLLRERKFFLSSLMRLFTALFHLTLQCNGAHINWFVRLSGVIIVSAARISIVELGVKRWAYNCCTWESCQVAEAFLLSHRLAARVPFRSVRATLFVVSIQFDE